MTKYVVQNIDNYYLIRLMGTGMFTDSHKGLNTG